MGTEKFQDISEDATHSMENSEDISEDAAETPSNDFFANFYKHIQSFVQSLGNQLKPQDVKAETGCSPAKEDLEVTTTDLSAEVKTNAGLTAKEDAEVPAEELSPVIETETESPS